jgi:hypothetical protein
MKRIDLDGQKFGRLQVLSFSHIGKDKRTYWDCVCDCGKTKIANGKSLRNGNVRSCGCFNTESIIKRQTTHGKTKIKEYNIWEKMKNRCYCEKDKRYKNYGGRGIKVCDEWKNSFENFINDMGLRPDINHSLDRIDNNKGYCKENCRWATRLEQANNKSNSRLLTYNGLSLTTRQWSEKLNVNFKTLNSRIAKKWTIERALNTPIINH